MADDICSEVFEILSGGRECRIEDQGASIPTDCVYPSFDQVWVNIVRTGFGYHVTDLGGAVSSALIHGRDETVIQTALKSAAARFGVEASGGVLMATAPTRDWLRSAVMGIANASAYAAQSAVDHIAKAKEIALHEKVYAALSKTVRPEQIKKEFPYHGESGRLWKAEYAVLRQGAPILLRGVVPHHASIVTTYAGFGDLPRSDGPQAIAVHDQALAPDDAALLRQVADVVPLIGLTSFARASVH